MNQLLASGEIQPPVVDIKSALTRTQVPARKCPPGLANLDKQCDGNKQCVGKALAKRWQSVGKALAKRWQCVGNALAMRR